MLGTDFHRNRLQLQAIPRAICTCWLDRVTSISVFVRCSVRITHLYLRAFYFKARVRIYSEVMAEEPMDTTNSSTVYRGKEIQLSITKNYAGHWETWEGVREMVQNWHDGLYSTASSMSKDELKFKKVLHPATSRSHINSCI